MRPLLLSTLLSICVINITLAQVPQHTSETEVLKLSRISVNPHLGMLKFGQDDVLIESLSETNGFGLKISNWYNAAYRNAFKINADGKIGLGTSAPRALLDVGGYASNQTLSTVLGRLAEGDGSNEGTYLGVRNYSAQPTNVKSFALEHGFYGNINSSVNFNRGLGADDGFLTFGTGIGNIERMRIANDGKVGINVVPTAQLHVHSVFPANGTANTQRWTSSIHPAYYLTLKTEHSAYGVNYNFVETFNGTDYSALSFLQGKVGIGTNRPDERLAVKGTIHAQEVKVDLQGAMAPDYVFDENYELMNLQDLESYLSKNKHLPEVPSAKDMEANGLRLGDMNLLLLKKVEELTLHLIRQDKEIIELKTKLKKLEN